MWGPLEAPWLCTIWAAQQSTEKTPSLLHAMCFHQCLQESHRWWRWGEIDNKHAIVATPIQIAHELWLINRGDGKSIQSYVKHDHGVNCMLMNTHARWARADVFVFHSHCPCSVIWAAFAVIYLVRGYWRRKKKHCLWICFYFWIWCVDLKAYSRFLYCFLNETVKYVPSVRWMLTAWTDS